MDENKKEKKSGFKDVVIWFKKYKKLIVIITVIIVIFSYLKMRNNCVLQVNYVAKVANGTPFEKAEHYTLRSKSLAVFSNEFKTKDEAVSYCMNRKFSLKN